MSENLLDPEPVRLNTLFTDHYVIPVYQRPYSWGSEQVQDIYDDLLTSFKNRDKDSYLGIFAGTIYLKDIKKEGKYTISNVIDGQQRITTFTLMILSIFWLFKDRKQTGDTITTIKKILWSYSDEDEKFDPEKRVLELGNLDKQLMIQIFDAAYNDGLSFSKFLETIPKSTIECEKLLIANLKFFYNSFLKEFPNTDDGNKALRTFFSFINNGTQFIRIYVHHTENKIFEIFESINSKGKKLEEIDLIKSYIFQLLDKDDYSTYSTAWGNLIQQTNDNLEDYLSIYIKAFIRFYKNALTVRNFKSLCKNELKTYYGVMTEQDAVKLLIDDLLCKVKCYNLLSDRQYLPKEFSNKKEFLFYYTSYNFFNYQHPKALIFKGFCNFIDGKLEYSDVKSILKNSLSFMLVYQTISSRDSKDAIAVFQKIIEQEYTRDVISIDNMKKEFQNTLKINNITLENLKNILTDYRGYGESNEKNESRVILAFYESIDQITRKVSYSNANLIMNSWDTLHIDHIMPQTPTDDNNDFFYFIKKDQSGKDVLGLKQGHDFPKEINDGMEYELFKQSIIHKLGNLRILNPTDNTKKSNEVLKIGDYSKFNTYEQIRNRAKNIAEFLFDSELLSIC